MASFIGTDTVENGLVIHLDAANIKSYSGNGVVCTDLSGDNNDATVLSQVTFQTNPNRFIFPTSTSTDSRIFVNHNDSLNYSYLNWAYCFWIRQLVDDDGVWAQLFIKGNDAGNRRPGVWFNTGNTSKLHIVWNYSGQSQQTLNTSEDFMLPSNTWHNITIQSRNGIMMAFKNAVQDINTIEISDRNVNLDPLHIGNRTESYRSLNMEISNFMVYNRSLTNEEISQNFEALRGRYGI